MVLKIDWAGAKCECTIMVLVLVSTFGIGESDGIEPKFEAHFLCPRTAFVNPCPWL